MADQPVPVTTQLTLLTLLSRVAYRGQEIAGARLRGLLALLAGDLRTGCSSTRLMEGLWPDEQPENPAKALQVLVSRARAQLGSELIISTPTGYRLSLREDQVDTAAVLLSASASARCSRAGDHAAALAHAEAGLALWEGAAGGDTGLDDPVSALRAERASTYRSLVRARALALSRLGRHAEAAEALGDLAAERPRDEEVLLELLRCEAATVGPSAALARYEAYRRSLRDELGADPGAALQAVHQQLLQGTSPVVRHGVPYEPNPLLGRDDDIAAVANLLRTSRVTSIVGAGGLGKTRLAQVVSRRAEQRTVHLVALAGVTTDDDVASEVASALGAGEPRRPPASQHAIPTAVLTGIAGALGPGPTLLVLDNCEHVIRSAAELVRALVSMTQDLRVLTTSRAPLGISSESVYLLPELDLPTPRGTCSATVTPWTPRRSWSISSTSRCSRWRTSRRERGSGCWRRCASSARRVGRWPGRPSRRSAASWRGHATSGWRTIIRRSGPTPTRQLSGSGPSRTTSCRRSATRSPGPTAAPSRRRRPCSWACGPSSPTTRAWRRLPRRPPTCCRTSGPSPTSSRSPGRPWRCAPCTRSSSWGAARCARWSPCAGCRRPRRTPWSELSRSCSTPRPRTVRPCTSWATATSRWWPAPPTASSATSGRTRATWKAR